MVFFLEKEPLQYFIYSKDYLVFRSFTSTDCVNPRVHAENIYKQGETGCDLENSKRACANLVPVIMDRPGNQDNACLSESGSRLHAMNTC